MTSLPPPRQYTVEELSSLYPAQFRLHHVQVLLRHGERTPVRTRFEHLGIPKFWNLCPSVKNFSVAVNSLDPSGLGKISSNDVPFERRVEDGNGQIPSTSLSREQSVTCTNGQLTSEGYRSTKRLGESLRHLYITQLGFLDDKLASQQQLYLRSANASLYRWNADTC